MNKENGFTLYIALVVSSAAILGAYAISNTLFRQLQLSSTALESQKTFYIAEMGLECAKIYDLAHDVFNTDTPFGTNGEVDNYEDFICGSGHSNSLGEIISTRNGGDLEVLGGANKSVFEMMTEDGGCAYVTVEKKLPDDDGYVETTITSSGYNICLPGSNRRLERTVQSTY